MPPRGLMHGSAVNAASTILLPTITGGLAAAGLSSATLVLSDDFNGTAGSAVDLSKWNYGENFNALRWDAMVRAEDARLDGLGNLKIIITNADIGHGVELSSGWVESNAQFGPGTFFEWGNVILDDGVGHGHTGCWTNTINGMTTSGVTYPTPSDGCEVDGAEYAPGIGYQMNVISGGYGGNMHSSAVGFSSGSAATSTTYGVLWTAAGYKFFKSGVSARSDYTSFVGTNTDQVIRFTIEHNFGAGSECYALCDYIRVWTVT